MRQSFTLTPGKCYTMLALGGVGITEMDIKLVGPIPGATAFGTLAQDTSRGSKAALGGKGNCYKWSFPQPAPANFVVKATTGQGVAVAQLYVK